ncbi:hypothetical protein EVAR_53603_1 [Eumeta japonica]|uniref:Uncharacterized protein n=1 Tax=Eumeta variegata TaxID=151549 RepID=A0A4C1X0Q7_EUMVA|nr:hypothetical protein EVAR_53603_1 [Eumeta japonica]
MDARITRIVKRTPANIKKKKKKLFFYSESPKSSCEWPPHCPIRFTIRHTSRSRLNSLLNSRQKEMRIGGGGRISLAANATTAARALCCH